MFIIYAYPEHRATIKGSVWVAGGVPLEALKSDAGITDFFAVRKNSVTMCYANNC